MGDSRQGNMGISDEEKMLMDRSVRLSCRCRGIEENCSGE